MSSEIEKPDLSIPTSVPDILARSLTPMNPEIKAQWIEALRSGNYKQGNGVLHMEADNNPENATYCCLGVLCEIALQAGIVSKALRRLTSHGDAIYAYGKTHMNSEVYLPPEVREWSGIPTKEDMVVNSTRAEAILSRMNDGERKTFTEIADWIQGNL